MPYPFTIHHLRFTAVVVTDIEMGEFKGSALRGAWQSHLRTLYCAERGSSARGAVDPLHASLCPVCYLLSREADKSDNRRPYTFEPPLTPQSRFAAGERFSFGMSIVGRAIQFLPYIVLSVQQMGETQGLGRAIHPGPRRGTFRLERIAEVNPLAETVCSPSANLRSGQRPDAERTLFAAGDPMIQMPQSPVDEAQVAAASAVWVARLADADNCLTLEFLTPTRIIHAERLMHRPAFVPLLARLVDRVSTLRVQFAELPPLSYEEKGELLAWGEQVELVRDETAWWDVKGLSTRLGRPQPLGGFVGRATYRAAEWTRLLPWLLWGASAHVGKNAIKGGGWYRLAAPAERTWKRNT